MCSRRQHRCIHHQKLDVVDEFHELAQRLQQGLPQRVRVWPSLNPRHRQTELSVPSTNVAIGAPDGHVCCCAKAKLPRFSPPSNSRKMNCPQYNGPFACVAQLAEPKTLNLCEYGFVSRRMHSFPTHCPSRRYVSIPASGSIRRLALGVHRLASESGDIDIAQEIMI